MAPARPVLATAGRGSRPRSSELRGIVFSYGSNLDLPDVRRWAREHGFAEGVRSVGRAWLPDHALAYHYFSPGRQGGALDVVPRRGVFVPGARVEVDDLAMFDGKEGADLAEPRYERVACHVIDEAGVVIPSEVYRVCAAFVRPDFVAPTEEYATIVERGCGALGVDPTVAGRVARDEAPLAIPLFVYGTLKRGHCRESLLRGGEVSVTEATVQGTLVDLGPYPGLQREGRDTVRGELWTWADPARVAELLGSLDGVADFCGAAKAAEAKPQRSTRRSEATRSRALAAEQKSHVEDFHGYDALERSMYERTLLPVRGADGRTDLAWAYVYRGGDGARIASGNWTGE